MATLVLHINREMIHHRARGRSAPRASPTVPSADSEGCPMPAHVPPVADEKDGLVASTAQQLDAFRSVAFGSPTTRPAPTPTPSALSVGALVSTPPA